MKDVSLPASSLGFLLNQTEIFSTYNNTITIAVKVSHVQINEIGRMSNVANSNQTQYCLTPLHEELPNSTPRHLNIIDLH